MGKRQKKGDKGEASIYVTRAQALRKLQCTLKDFRRICILKGVFPRAPKKSLKGRDKTYYLAKDIRFLSHEPLLEHIAKFRVWKRRLSSAKGRGEQARAAVVAGQKPTFRLDNMLRERYPTLDDAVQDLDDALCSVHLFAALPVKDKVPAGMIEASTRLVAEWQCWVIATRALRKVFLSIKGVYFQIDIRGVSVTWIAPWPFQLRIPKSVDATVLMTFNDLHAALLRFVMFRIFSDTGRAYPPQSAGLPPSAPLFAINTTQEGSLDVNVADESETTVVTDSSAFLNSKQQEQQKRRIHEADACKKLFAGCVVFFSREIAVGIFAFIVRCCGGSVGWEGPGSPFDSNDASITHHVVDRPLTHRFLSREYVQPQWIADSLNARILLPTSEYLPGLSLPPHLSPFVDNASEGYIPERAKEIASMQESTGMVPAEFTPAEAALASKTAQRPKRPVDDMDADTLTGADSEPDSTEPKKAKKAELDPAARKRAMMLLPKKQANLYKKMQHGIKQKQKAVRKLETRRDAYKGKK
eukprot:TRINITY_DN9095_c0_g1_i1.p1 TRINITY_DN9095_c0_g1~~TRINITY_DN9095_c0_g1_i1.p1  ORF type:complete len:542 (-),score=73.58 TRINITY_DN9095_c0_g1_i1:139-1719(-)